ncbi:hypothetical protein DH2020_038718 [Rehmannia glutinosa]|uniref:Amine oxidase domain-containing protein n=1 Tax=Rehmannia glutinosa TaxID=99300 RepID=A0ABR0V011_REHGL
MSRNLSSLVERQHNALPSVIVVGGGISGIAAARCFKMHLLRLHGVCNENPLSPIIRRLGLTLYRTSGDDSILYDHDLESCSLFDINGHQVPQSMVVEVGVAFKKILEETDKVRNEQSNDISVKEAISIVLDRHPDFRQEGLAYEVLQWYLCRMEAWFAADADMISLKAWDQENVLSGGHGLMVQGYDPVIKALSRDIDIRLNHRCSYICDVRTSCCFTILDYLDNAGEWVKKIVNGYNKVVVTVEDGSNFIGDAVIVTVPLGILKANLIEFEPKLPEWKLSAISDLGHPVLVYMAAGALSYDLEKLSDEAAADFVMLQLKRMFPDATGPVQYLVSRWGTDPNILGCYSYDAVGNSEDIYDKPRAPVGNLFFGGEAVSVEHQGWFTVPTPLGQWRLKIAKGIFCRGSGVSRGFLWLPVGRKLLKLQFLFRSQDYKSFATVLLGDMGAGKSSLVIRFVKGQFLEFQESTIGAAFFSQSVSVNNATVKFEIWDTAGQERYHSLAPMYYRGAAAAIIVYDITSSDSFGRAKKWVQELQKQGNPNMVMALAGNKCDLEDKRNVTAEVSIS